jgi:hypothetical protein
MTASKPPEMFAELADELDLARKKMFTTEFALQKLLTPRLERAARRITILRAQGLSEQETLEILRDEIGGSR